MDMDIANQFKAFRAANRQTAFEGLAPHLTDLIDTDSFAFLIGAVFDRAIHWRKAWEIPYHIAQRDMLDPEKIAQASDTDLSRLLHTIPVKPRYPNQGVRTLRDAAELTLEFGGDAAKIWEGVSPRDVEGRLCKIYGVGQGIAAMSVRILHEHYGYFQDYGHQIDIRPDVNLMRVFRRSGLCRDEYASECVNVARRLSPEAPWKLDFAAWYIGQEWCHSSEPDCAHCPLSRLCPKLI